MNIIKIIEDLLGSHNIDDARQKAQDAADEVCKEIEANREVVYFTRQNTIMRTWREVDEEEYERIMRERGHTHAMKLFRHAEGKVTTVPTKITVEVQ